LFSFFFLKVGDLKILINWEIRQNESFTSIIKIVISIDLKQWDLSRVVYVESICVMAYKELHKGGIYNHNLDETPSK